MAPFGHTLKKLGTKVTPSRATSLPPVRRSARLAGEPPDHGLLLSEQTATTPEGVVVHSRVVYNNVKGTWEGDWAYRVDKNTRKKQFFPGQIIMAVDAHPQTILQKTLDDIEIGQTACAPIHAKMRAMVVIHLTYDGMLCLPMYSNTKVGKPAPRYWEMASISNDNKWPGKTAWAGPPLRMRVFGPADQSDDDKWKHSLIELLRPVHVLSVSRIAPYGFMTGGEYSRLMQILTYKEIQARTAAFLIYNEKYSPVLSWKPTTGERKPYTTAEMRMNSKTHLRW